MQDSGLHTIGDMSESGGLAGFEYSGKKDETPFETFLRYTDEKHKSATQLSTILQDRMVKGTHMLDVGAGNGEYLHRALAKVKGLQDVMLTLIEPSDSYVDQLHTRFRDIPAIKVRIIRSTFEKFDSKRKLDIVLMSHVLSRLEWNQQLAKALSLLKPGGVLIVVLRGKDDVYTFKMQFKPLLFGKTYKALIIDDVLERLSNNAAFGVSRYPVRSVLNIPYSKNVEDTRKIIEFYLNERWLNIPISIQQGALRYIANKKGRLNQLDCIAVVEKV